MPRKKLTTEKKCLNCDVPLLGLRRKFCSKECKIQHYAKENRKTPILLLYETHKELVDIEWDYEKNNKLGLDPTNLASQSGKKVFWICKNYKEHKWDATISNRTNKDNETGCPYCSGRRFDHTNCLSTLHPELSKEWNYKKNKNLKPENVVSKSNKKVWWICPKGHEWKAIIAHRTNGSNCSYCSGNRVCIDNCLLTLNPELCKEWNYKKNKEITPRNITTGTSKKVWWLCFKGHEWEASVSNRNRGTACPYCSNKKVCLENCLLTRFPEIAKEWDYKRNGKLTPENIMPGSMKKIWWVCNSNNKHKWKVSPNARTNGNRGCLKCAIEKTIKTTEEFVKDAIKVHGNKYDYSKVEYKDSNSKIIIFCPIHGKYIQSPKGHLSGRGCSSCINKNEGKVKKLLFKYFKKWEIIPGKKIWDEYKNYKHKRFCDFWLEKNDIKIIVEYDGEGHFYPIRFNGMSLKTAKENLKNYRIIDKKDAEFCKENNILLWRIKYNENKEKRVLELKKLLNN